MIICAYDRKVEIIRITLDIMLDVREILKETVNVMGFDTENRPAFKKDEYYHLPLY